MSIRDEPRPEGPLWTDDVTVKKVECLILEDRQAAIQMIMNETGVSYGSVQEIIHNELHMFKVSTYTFQDILTLFEDEEDFFCHMVTMVESQVYWYDPETKTMSMEWKHVDSPPPKKAKVQKLAWKVMHALNFYGTVMESFSQITFQREKPSLAHTTAICQTDGSCSEK